MLFHCAFYPVPHLNGQIKNTEQIFSILDDVSKTGDLKAISLTGGVEQSPDRELERMTRLMEEVAMEYNVPIGVSVYPTPDNSDALYAAGADEVNHKVETMDRDIFSRVCPDLLIGYVVHELGSAGELFGKDHVSSNIIIGLGESDETVLAGVDHLAGIGVIPVLRAVVMHKNLSLPYASRPSADRLLNLAIGLRESLNKHGLSPRNARTMCLPCTGCDLIPGRDL